MVAEDISTFKCASIRFSYHDAVRLAELVHRGNPGCRAIIDLAEADQATTAAMARLIVLRGKLRRSGGDLHLVHLHGRARQLYEINRLSGILPCDSQQPAQGR